MDHVNYSITIEDKGSYLFARANGVRTRGSVIAITKEIFDAAVAGKLSKVLIDVRELKGQLGVLDSYYVVTEEFEKLRGKGLRKAAIMDKKVRFVREWFLELVATNRGLNLKVFTSKEEAIKWFEL